MVSARFSEGFDDVGSFQIAEMRKEVDAFVGQVKFGFDAFGVVVGDMFGKAFGLDFVPITSERFDLVLCGGQPVLGPSPVFLAPQRAEDRRRLGRR